MTAETQPRLVRVVVVDDTPDLRELLRYALEQHEFTVVGEAGDGRAGLDVATRLRPDLLLLDLAMPGMDGFEVLPQVRAACPGTKIVVLSGFDAAAVQDRARELGADGFVHKGGSLSATIRYVREVLGVPDAEADAGPALSVVRAPSVTARPDSLASTGWLAPVPFGVVEVDDDTAMTVRGSNPAACALLGPGLRVGVALSTANPLLATELGRQRHQTVMRAQVPSGPVPSQATALQVTASRAGRGWCLVVTSGPESRGEDAERLRVLRPLRAPMAQVRETTRRLLVAGAARDEEDEARQARLLGDLRRHIDRLTELCDGLEPEPAPAAHHPRGRAEGAVLARPHWCELADVLAPVASSHTVEVSCDRGTLVLVDAAQLRELLGGLLHDGPAAPLARRRTPQLSAAVRDGALLIELTDQVDRSPHRLAAVRELAAAHGGTIEHRQGADGVRWTIRIPQPRI